MCVCVCECLCFFFFFFSLSTAPSNFSFSHCYIDAVTHLSLRKRLHFFDKSVTFRFVLRFETFAADWCCVFWILNFSIAFFALRKYFWDSQKSFYEAASIHRIKYWNSPFLIRLSSTSFTSHFFSFSTKMNCGSEFSPREYHDFKSDTWNTL